MTTTFFVIMVVSKPIPSVGIQQSTLWWTPKGGPGTTRSELFHWALEKLPENLRGGTVLYFSAEPDVIKVPGSARR
ncbi:hypothetical protein LUW76_46870 [Actinomadura madurae]|uniref:hypothetical protein n=1 Tax=Actinomadura madurae TaxID=1993 RepID=UPI00202742D8|nr:hypothetical protein [Actinomadura madurae]URN01223.1 hypothetical protein LUW76_46870 [Actinomadura madurae]